MTKVLVIHNIPSPYRLPIFESLSKIVNLEVVFLDSEMKDRYWDNQVENYDFNYSFLKSFSYKGLSWNPRLIKKIVNDDFDVVIFVDDLPTIINSYIIALTAKMTKKKIIIWNGRFHNGVFSTLEKNSKSKIIESFIKLHTKLLYKFADSIISYGKKAKDYLVGTGVEGSKIISGTQTFPKSLINFDVKKVSDTDGNIKFLTISYLNKRKGIDLLIKAFKNSKAYNGSILYIVGDGPEREKLEKINGNDQRIQFKGNLEGEKKYQIMNECDVFVLPTLYDSWGLVINEAMEFGLPIISTDMAMASSELIKSNGYIVEANNEVELKTAIEDMYFIDLNEMSRISRTIIKKINVQYVVKNFEKAIRMALG